MKEKLKNILIVMGSASIYTAALNNIIDMSYTKYNFFVLIIAAAFFVVSFIMYGYLLADILENGLE